ncbi:MAG: ABC transporter permease [Pseudomonadota bacterium]
MSYLGRLQVLTGLGGLGRFELAWPLAKKELISRYRGSVGGALWALFTPLLAVTVYALVFQGVFKARWPGTEVGGLGYAMRTFAGLMVFTSVTEVAMRSTRLIQDNASLVKRVVFPLELLGVALLMQSAVHTLLQVAILAVLLGVTGDLRWSWLLLPLAWAWVLALQLAITWLLSALGCYLRDLQHLVPAVISGLMFLTPVFYPIDAAPKMLKAMLYLNPMSAPIELMRMAWFGSPFDWTVAWPQLVVLIPLLVFSRWFFERARPGFADLV